MGHNDDHALGAGSHSVSPHDWPPIGDSQSLRYSHQTTGRALGSFLTKQLFSSDSLCHQLLKILR